MKLYEHIGLGLAGLVTALSLNIMYPAKNPKIEVIDKFTQADMDSVSRLVLLSTQYQSQLVSLLDSRGLVDETRIEYLRLRNRSNCSSLVKSHFEGRKKITIIERIPSKEEYVKCLQDYYLGFLNQLLKTTTDSEKKKLEEITNEVEKWN